MTITLLALAVLNRKRADRVTLTLPLVIIVGALALTVLQLIPMPQAVIAGIAPGAHDILTMSLGNDFGWAPLSMDPPATSHEVLKLVAYSAVALLTLMLFREPRHERQLLTWIMASGVCVGLLGFVHELARLERSYGFFGPANGVFTSSFINPNHLGAFLSACGIVAIGLAMTGRGPWRWLYVACAAGMGTGVILTLSRGAILAFLAAIGFLAAAGAIDRSRSIRRIFVAQAAVTGAFLVAAYLAYTPTVHEMWTLSGPRALKKTEIWQPLPAMLGDFPVMGVGRGAFSAVYPRYRSGDLRSTFTHLENDWLQTVVDWGWVGGGALILMTIAAFALLLRRARGEPTHLAAASALLFLAIQNIGDFSLEVSGVALVAVVLLTRFESTRIGAAHTSNGTATVLRLGAAALAVIATTVVWPAVFHTLGRDTSDVIRTLKLQNATPAQREAHVRGVVDRHPADYFIPALLAERELRERGGAKRALHWINRAMYLAPSFAPAHRLAARALLQLGAQKQALDEFRSACELAPDETKAVAAQIFRMTGSAEDVLTLANSDVGPVKLAVAQFLFTASTPEDALAALEKGDLLASPEAAELATRAMWATHDYRRAVGLAREIENRWPERQTAYIIEARIALKEKNDPAAFSAFARGERFSANPAAILVLKATVLLRRGEIVEARRIADGLLGRAGTGRSRAQAHWLAGQIYEREHRPTRALREYQYAIEGHPGSISYRLCKARLHEQLEDMRGAREELLRAQADLGPLPRISEALKRLDTP